MSRPENNELRTVTPGTPDSQWMHEQLYRFGPFTLQVRMGERQHQERLGASWQQLFRIEPTATMSNLRLQITLDPGAARDIAHDLAARQLLTSARNLSVWRTANGFQCICGATVIQIQSGQQQATGWLAADFWDYTLVEQRDFWQRVFFLLVRQANGYLLHANALYFPALGQEAGVLLVGDCGAGKTTLTLSLITAGWGYVTDDTVLLQSIDDNPLTLSGYGLDVAPSPTLPLTSAPKAGSILAHAVRRGFACTEQTVAQWQWVAPLQVTAPRLGRAKTLITLDSLYPASFAPACSPRLLLFPRISGDGQSQLTQLSIVQSFTTLLGQPRTGILVEPAATPALLALFQALVQQTQGYQLDLGRDVLTEPERVSALLAHALEAT